MPIGKELQPRRSPGRPKVPAKDHKRHAIMFRVTEQVSDFLERIADSQGRPVANEVERRVLLTFELDADLGDDPRALALFRTLAAAVHQVAPDGQWFDDYERFETIRSRWDGIIAGLAPAPAGPEPPWAEMIRVGLRIPDRRENALIVARAFMHDSQSSDDLKAAVQAVLEADQEEGQQR